MYDKIHYKLKKKKRKNYSFFYFWLYWVFTVVLGLFVAGCRLSLVAVSGDYSLIVALVVELGL